MTTLSGFVESFGGLAAVRFMLGFCEGAVLPAMASSARCSVRESTNGILGSVSEYNLQKAGTAAPVS